jgi:hypothetical protein
MGGCPVAAAVDLYRARMNDLFSRRCTTLPAFGRGELTVTSGGFSTQI